jgi:Ribosomal protein L22
MSDKLTAVAKDNTVRVSSLKLANVARSIVNLKASKAINQLKFSQKKNCS